MPQKRAARRGSNTTVSGSKDSVELGRNGEYRPAKKPSPELVEGSQFRKGMAAARDGTTKPPKTATTEPASSRAGEMPSKYSASRRQELPPSEEEGEEKEKEKESEEESKEAPGPNPQPKRKRASGRVTRSQQQRGSEESTEAPSPNPQPKRKRASGRVTRSQQRRRKEEGAQPSESKKPKSKKITLAPLQQQLSQSEMPKSKKIAPAPLQQQGEERAEPSESETPKSKRIRRIWTPSDEVRILKALVKHRHKEGKLPAPDNKEFFDSIAKRLKDKSCNLTHIKDKVRSMRRRYKSFVAPSTDHEKRLYDLSDRVWGDLPANGSNGDGQQAEGEHAMAEAENGCGQTLDRSFEEMCEMYPFLGQEVKRLEGVQVQPALRSSFTGLDGKKALLMEQKLGKLKWKELKIQAEMEAKVEAPKARIRNQLVNFLSKNI